MVVAVGFGHGPPTSRCHNLFRRSPPRAGVLAARPAHAGVGQVNACFAFKGSTKNAKPVVRNLGTPDVLDDDAGVSAGALANSAAYWPLTAIAATDRIDNLEWW